MTKPLCLANKPDMFLLATFLPYYLIRAFFGGEALFKYREGSPIGRILLKSPGNSFGGCAGRQSQMPPGEPFEAAPIAKERKASFGMRS
jgi:hypothetical protein